MSVTENLDSDLVTLTGRKRRKRIHPSERQKIALIEFFEEDMDSLRIVRSLTNDHSGKQHIWIKLAHKLNSLNGALKSTLKWAKYFNDIVHYAELRAKNAIAGKLIGPPPPSDIEKRILTMVGQEHLIRKWMACRGFKIEDTVEIIDNLEEVDYDSNYTNDVEITAIVSEQPELEDDFVENKTDTSTVSITENEIDIKKEIGEPHLKKFKTSDTASTTPIIKSDDDNTTDNSEATESLTRLKDALTELPQIMLTMSDSFLAIGQAFRKCATALDKFTTALETPPKTKKKFP